jgi:Mrp family chromosome partitioning ATPase
MAARARNALRRPILIGSIGAPVFIGALIAIILVPRGATRAARVAAPKTAERTDIAPLAASVESAKRTVYSADSTIGEVRRAIIAATAPPIDTLPPHLRARRDSLAVISGRLGRLLARVETAPLLASYRELGVAPELRDDGRVHALLDTLAEIEKERDAFGAVGVDPVFIELTSRATAIGREIQGIAQERRNAVRRELAALRPTPAPPPVIPIVDTTAILALRDSASAVLVEATRALALAQQKNRDVEARAEHARQVANIPAPPVAMLAASLVIAGVFGFIVTLLLELRQPKVADVREAEHLAGHRVLAVVQAQRPMPERARRLADLHLPPLLDLTSESYRLLYLHLAPLGSTIPIITVIGDEPAVVATVGANLAAAASYENRTTLLIDADVETGGVSGVLHINPDPGLAGIADDSTDWATAIVTTSLGRGRVLDVVPGGEVGTRRTMAPIAKLLERDLPRVATRYDLVVVVAPLIRLSETPTVPLPQRDVVLCVRTGYSKIAGFSESVAALQDAKATVHGLVLWDMPAPVIPTRDEVIAARSAPIAAERREKSFA